MFDDLGEVEAVFYQLDEDSESPTTDKLNWICSHNSEFNKRLTELMNTIHERETRAGMEPGSSHQSSILADLWYRLSEASNPAKLLAHLPELKELLLMSMVISVELKTDTLKLIIKDNKQNAEYGEKFLNSKRGMDALSKEIVEILKETGKDASAKEIWKKMIERGEDPKNLVIDEVVGDGSNADEDIVYWRGTKETKFRSFENRLSELRNKI
jgi:phosphatidylglycerophosphatase A